MSFCIRAAVLADAAKCADIHMRSWVLAYKDSVPEDIIDSHNARRPAMWKELLANNTDVHYVALLDDTIIGIITINPSYDTDLPKTVYELSGLYLDPDFVGKGFGRLIMDWIKNEISSRGYKAISLWVLDRNFRARAFYDKCGFKPDGKSKESGIGDTLKERYIFMIPDVHL